jgi:hypothetical protein
MDQLAHKERFTQMNAAAERLLAAALDGGIETLLSMQDDMSMIDVRRDDFCFSCDMCYSLCFNLAVLQDLIDKKVTPLQAKRQLQAYKYATYADQAHNGMGTSTKRRFARTSVQARAELVYLDQNILTAFVNDEAIRTTLLDLKKKGTYQFVYSPSHIEEIHKIKEESNQAPFLDSISQLTDDVSLQPADGDRISLFKEAPVYPLERVASAPDTTEAVEKMKALKEKDRELYFNEYNENSHRVAIGNSEDVFGALPHEEFSRLMTSSASSRLRKEEFKDLKSHSEILNAIHALHNALDLLSYKREQSERARKSSIHDIEHLIYATRCRVFVSKDGRLVSRARQIYKFLELDISVHTLDEFLKCQSAAPSTAIDED